jgi:hypothetical protein
MQSGLSIRGTIRRWWRKARTPAAVSPRVARFLLVEVGPEGWTPTQQPPVFSPSLRLLQQGFCFYLCEERKR